MSSPGPERRSTPGYGLAVTSLIVGIVSILLVPVCGLGILTAILGFVLAVSARRVATRVPEGAPGVATAGIVVNGVILASATVGLGLFGVGFVGTLMLPAPRPSVVATKDPAHETPAPPTEGMMPPTARPTAPPLAWRVALGESAKVGSLRRCK